MKTTSTVTPGLVIAAIAMAVQTHAVTIPVQNSSFEETVLSDGERSNGHGTPVPGWRSSGGGFGVMNPTDTQLAQNGAGSLDSPNTGQNVLYLDGSISGENFVYQVVGTVQPNTLYTLSASVGTLGDPGSNPEPTLQLCLRNYFGIIYSSVAVSPPTIGTGFERQLSFTTGPLDSGELAIELYRLPAATGDVFFDNIRLEAKGVPDTAPGGASMLAMGAIGWMVLRRRR